ncbi:MAG TPA: gfo/Idh/MocA family oxidoreductase, partial [Anaeromyxobacteraceae bacterium]|nr:gfo/Idh/MocA family oxidoreductase [Anaeromyxobacteraceae bacterium]
ERHAPRPGPGASVAAPTAGWRTSPLVRRVAEVARSRRARVTTRWAEGNGYGGEAVEAMRCLREGLVESPTMPLDDTLAVLETVDAIRRASGAA